MSPIDWTVVAVYLLFALGVGVWAARRVSSSEEEYFVAGRTLPWWLAGTSMVATTFAADTPLAVAGLVAAGGIAGNWIWWTAGVGHVVTAVVFARWWRRLELVTDAEVLERRYSGRSAAFLRALKAGYEAVFINCLALGWVILAMRKFVGILFPEVDAALATIGLVAVAVFYSTLGGIRSVVLTDMVQFVLAMVAAIALAWLAVEPLGGLGGLVSTLHETYPDRGADLLAFAPSAELPGMSATLFAVLLTVGWWRYGQGGGYIVQRLNATRSDVDAERAGVLFATLHNAVRPWPWILVGLAALIVWPLDGGVCQVAADCAASYECVDAVCRVPDREATYVMMMSRTLPAGLLGLMVAGMLAAFMSTVDTHVNWGSSYVVTDFWQRWVDPEAPGRRLVAVGRVGVVAIATLATTASFFMESIAAVWVFLITLGSGMGGVAMAKWLWWRINAPAEITAIASATVLAVGLDVVGSAELFGATNPFFVVEISKSVTILVVALGSTALAIAVALLTRPTDEATLREFHDVVRPPALGWRRFAGDAAGFDPRVLLRLAAGFLAVFGTLFGLGGMLLGETVFGSLLLTLASLGAFAWLLVADR